MVADMRESSPYSQAIGFRIIAARAFDEPALTQEDLAREVGVTRGAVGNWELGRGVKLGHILKLAEVLRVDFNWLATGRGSPRPGESAVTPAWRIALAGRVGAGAIVDSFEADDAALAGREFVELPSSLEARALVVDGDSMRPRFYPGEILIYERAPRLPAELIDRYAVVELLDGRQKVKILRRGRTEGRWRLDSHNADPDEDVVLRAAYRFIGMLAAPEQPGQAPEIVSLTRSAKRAR